MPRRNIFIVFWAVVISCLCYVCVDRSAGTLRYVREIIQTHGLEPVQERQLLDGALQGMMGTLDEFSSYMPPKGFQKMNEELAQEFGGVGLSFGFREEGASEETGRPTVHFVLPDTPSSRAGVKAGDVMLSVNETPLEGKTMAEISSMLRGEVGSTVMLGVERPSEQKTISFLLTREAIHTETVEGDVRRSDGTWEYFLPPGAGNEGEKYQKIAYVRITSFAGRTADEMAECLRTLRAKGAQGLILDLRDNSGGLLDAAIKTCDLFLEDEIIVSTRGRDAQQLEEFRATPGVLCRGIPLAILINENSASASEIVAACLQDYGETGTLKSVCIGTRTYGKGTVQQLIPIGYLPGDGTDDAKNTETTSLWKRFWETPQRGALRLTVASYWRPSGKNIHRFSRSTEEDSWGVLPNEGMYVEMPKKKKSTRAKKNSSESAVEKTELDVESTKSPWTFVKMREARWSGSLPPEDTSIIFELDPPLKKAVEWMKGE